MSNEIALETVSCPRCGSNESEPQFQARDYLYGVPGVFTASRCLVCALTFQNPRPTPETLSLAYPSSYIPHSSDMDEIAPPIDGRVGQVLSNELGYTQFPVPVRRMPKWWQRWKVTVDLIPAFRPDGAVLEIGAATGSRLRGLRALGWSDLHGIELVDSAASLARRSGFDVRTGSVESMIVSIPDSTYDVVIASFVLEHLYNPFEIVKEVTRILKPGGEFLFSTITRDSLDGRLWGKWWAGYDFPRHMVYFDNRDLRGLTSDFQWCAEARHDAIQDYARESWWRLMECRNITDRVVGRLAKTHAGSWISRILAWSRLGCRISVRARKADVQRISA